MSFIRPEALRSLRKYRGFIFAGMVLIAGLLIVLSSFGTTRLMGGVIAVMGALIGHDAYRRFKFPVGHGGAGVVEVDERQVSYFTAGKGHSISLDSLERIELHRNMHGRTTWVFFGPEGMLSVPGDAEGTGNLFDALVALPGVNYAQAEAASQGRGPDLFLIWQRNRRKLH